jgi:cardiolipin synthase
VVPDETGTGGAPPEGHPHAESREERLVKYEITTTRVFTIPNILSMGRLLMVPVFMWLLLGPGQDGETWADVLALVLLPISAFTDWLDGYLARRWNQISRVGQLLDPIADRLFIVATVIAFMIRDIVPWWFVALIVGRDLVMAVGLLVLQRAGITGLPVHFLGKAATFVLLYALPFLLLADTFADQAVGDVALVLGWACGIWGVALYWYAGVLYFEQARRLVGHQPAKGQGQDLDRKVV